MKVKQPSEQSKEPDGYLEIFAHYCGITYLYSCKGTLCPLYNDFRNLVIIQKHKIFYN